MLKILLRMLTLHHSTAIKGLGVAMNLHTHITHMLRQCTGIVYFWMIISTNFLSMVINDGH
jgi:hypothetical protein